MRRPSRRGVPLDERSFHRWLQHHLPAGRRGPLPLGDDAAALRVPRGRLAIVTTDALVEGTHFVRASPPQWVGRAAAAVNFSDLAAKGARPAALLLALVVPPGTPQSWAARVVEGAERLSESFGATIVGGDTKPGPVRSVVGFAVGWASEKALPPRRGARPGDVLVTTGVVGRGGLAALGLAAARRGDRRALRDLLDVRPRVREGEVLARYAHALLDTSDGLAEAAHLLAEASRVRVVVEEDRLPLAPRLARLQRREGVRWRRIAFFGGDYELLAALSPSQLDRAARGLGRHSAPLRPIGRVERGRGAWLAVGNRRVALPRAGWQPFARTGRRLPRTDTDRRRRG